MSAESLQWLNENTLIGYTDKRGNAWHYRAGADNHFKGEVPLERVKELFGFTVLESPAKFDVILPDGSVETRVDPREKKYYRSDTLAPLGTHGINHQPHQFEEWLVHKVETLLDARLAIGQAGLLRGGAVAWVSVEMAETVKTYGGVEIRPQLMAATSFDASLATTHKLVSNIVVCDNSMQLALTEDAPVSKIRHSSGAIFNPDKVRDTLGLVEDYSAHVASKIEKLVETKVTERKFEKFLQIYIPMPEEDGRAKTIATNKQEAFRRLWTSDARVVPWQGTGFGVVQAANTWLHHESTVRGGERAERNTWRAITSSKAESIGSFDAEVMKALAHA